MRRYSWIIIIVIPIVGLPEGLSLGVFQGPNDSLLGTTADFTPGPDDPRNALWLFQLFTRSPKRPG